MENTVNIFAFFRKKKSCQSKESPLSEQSLLSEQSPFSPAPLFLEKIFHPHSYCQIRSLSPPSVLQINVICPLVTMNTKN